MRIESIRLHNFRCFEDFSLSNLERCTIITGANGAGKTSILEALHYACYFRSFKTHRIKEIARAGQHTAGINLSLAGELSYDALSVHFEHPKKKVHLNEKPITSFKQLYDTYRVVTITEHDLELIQGAPAVRRTFIDQMISIGDPQYMQVLKRYKSVIDNRNALLAKFNDYETYTIWTTQLLELTKMIQAKRASFLALLESQSQDLIAQFFSDTFSVAFDYQSVKPYSLTPIDSIDQLFSTYPGIYDHERAFKRSLIGAHLDDFHVSFQDKSSRIYASRGQQKLIVFLLKLSYIRYLNELYKTDNTILLVDDFVTDFDQVKLSLLLSLMTTLPSQLIMTSPLNQTLLSGILSNFSFKYINV